MKRDRVYLSKPDRLPFAPDQASALTRLMAVLESSFDGIFITDGQATPCGATTPMRSSPA